MRSAIIEMLKLSLPIGAGSTGARISLIMTGDLDHTFISALLPFIVGVVFYLIGDRMATVDERREQAHRALRDFDEQHPEGKP